MVILRLKLISGKKIIIANNNNDRLEMNRRKREKENCIYQIIFREKIRTDQRRRQNN